MWWWLPTPAHCEVSWQNKGGGCSLERCGKFGKKSCHILLWCYFSCFIPLSRHYDHESRDLHAGLHQLRHNGSLSKKPNQLFKSLSVLSSKLLCFHNVKVILDVQTEHWKTRSGTSTFIGEFCRSKHRVFFHHSEPLSPSHCFRFSAHMLQTRNEIQMISYTPHEIRDSHSDHWYGGLAPQKKERFHGRTAAIPWTKREKQPKKQQ